MLDTATQLPVRRPELNCCRLDGNGYYLVRNRATGESFQLGREEQFLLSALDGRQSPGEICAAFTEQFDSPLTAAELADFVELSAQRNLLQDSSPPAGSDVGPLEQVDRAPLQIGSHPVLWKRLTIRVLKLLAAVLGWSAWLPNFVAEWLQGRVRGLEFTPRADDVFIVTYPRSGTTWLQMILYQLTTDGEVNFPHIAEYCPWFEKSVRSARGFELRPSPRLFKSHLPHSRIPKGDCRYIYVARDGRDVALSYYHLYCRYNGYEGTFDEFFERFLKGKVDYGSWFEHMAGWWKHRDDPNVLFLTYEQLQDDFDGAVRRISDFCGREFSPETLNRVRCRASFEFMKQHEDRFDPVLESLWEQGVQLKSFLRNGRVGEGATTLSEVQQNRFNEAFTWRLKPLGVPV